MKCFVRVRPAFLPRNSRPANSRRRAIRVAAGSENRRQDQATIRRSSSARRRAIATVFGRIRGISCGQ